MSRYLCSCFFMIVLCMNLPARAQIPVGPFDVSLAVQAGSEYSFRGITQSNRKFAAQGSVRVEHTSGVFGQVSGANIDYAQGNFGGEFDIRLGYTSEATFMSFLSYEFGVSAKRYFDVMNTDNLNHFEGFASLGGDFKIFSVYAGVNYSPDYYNRSGSSTYYSVSGFLPIFDIVELSAHGGYHMISDAKAFGIGRGEYTDWSVTAALKFFGARAFVKYLGTNLPESDRCISANCAERLVFGTSIGF